MLTAKECRERVAEQQTALEAKLMAACEASINAAIQRGDTEASVHGANYKYEMLQKVANRLRDPLLGYTTKMVQISDRNKEAYYNLNIKW